MTGANRVLIRLARRSVTKAPLRSLLVVALIAIVVAVGTGSAIAIRSATPTFEDHRLANFGSSDTMITIGPGTLEAPPIFADEPIYLEGNYIDPTSPTYQVAVDELIERQKTGRAWAENFDGAAVAARLQSDLDQAVLVSRQANLGLTGGPFQYRPALGRITDIDMTNPLAEGYLRLIDGRFPQSANEIAVAASDNNYSEYAVGDRITFDQITLDVVGLITTPSSRYYRTGLVTAVGFDALTTRADSLIVEVRTDLGDDQARRNATEVFATGLDWPVTDFWAASASDFGLANRTDPAIRVVPALISSVLGIQLALVAAAAFAVGIRRRTKEFGQLITTGMDGAQLRRMILFEAVWLGLIGAVVGVVLGVVGVSQLINLGWINEIGERYVDAPRWNVVDWLGPACIGVLAAVGAAWWPARALENAPVTSALAGHLPAGRPTAATPRWGLLIVILGSLLVGGLAAATSADQGSLSFAVIFVGAVAITFMGTLLFIGSILTVINERSGRFPLLARLVVRSSARHRTRSWMVVGAFIATLALPVLVGASVKAYPNSSGVSGEFDRRILTVRNDVPDLPLPASAPADLDLRAEIEQFNAELNQAIVDELEPTGSVVTDQAVSVRLSVVDGGSRTGFDYGMTVLTPELAQLLDLPTDMVASVDANTVLYVGTSAVRGLEDGEVVLTMDRGNTDWNEVTVDVIVGPPMFNNEFNTLISPALAQELDVGPMIPGTLHYFAEPLSISAEETIYDRANNGWIERFGAYDVSLGAGSATPSFEMLDFVMRQTRIDIQQSYPISPTQRQLQWGSIALTGVLAALIALITASLAAVELDGELQSMVATGAPPRMRRMMLGAQTLYHLLLAAVLGIPLALLLFYAVSRADDFGPRGPVFPWGAIGLSAIVIPVVVATLVAAVFRNGRPAISRRLS